MSANREMCPRQRANPSGRERAVAPLIAATIRQGQQLVAAPRASRDLRWYVEAAFLGDLPALASARLNARDVERHL